MTVDARTFLEAIGGRRRLGDTFDRIMNREYEGFPVESFLMVAVILGPLGYEIGPLGYDTTFHVQWRVLYFYRFRIMLMFFKRRHGVTEMEVRFYALVPAHPDYVADAVQDIFFISDLANIFPTDFATICNEATYGHSDGPARFIALLGRWDRLVPLDEWTLNVIANENTWEYAHSLEHMLYYRRFIETVRLVYGQTNNGRWIRITHNYDITPEAFQNIPLQPPPQPPQPARPFYENAAQRGQLINPQPARTLDDYSSR